jgi:hypothetical protein
MGMLCLVSIKFEFIWLEDEIGSRHVAPERRRPICRPTRAEIDRGCRRAATPRKNRTARVPPRAGRRDIGRGARRPPNNRMITPRGTSVARLFRA